MEQNLPPQFKAKPAKALPAFMLAILSFAAAILFFSEKLQLMSIVLLFAGILFGVYATVILTKPYILFLENGIVIRVGLLFLPKKLNFTDIEKIERIEPDHFISISMKSGPKIGFSLSTLQKEDRIRFIFLIESDVNRLKIMQQ